MGIMKGVITIPLKVCYITYHSDNPVVQKLMTESEDHVPAQPSTTL